VPGLGGALAAAVPSALAGARDPGSLALIAVAGFALGVNVAVALRHFRRGWTYGAGYLGHAGLAVMVLGIALSSSLGRSERLELAQGRTVKSLGYALTFHGAEPAAHGGRVLRIAVESERWRLDARPELMPSPRDQGVVRKPAISATRELYLSPVDYREGDPGADVTWLEKGTPLEVGGARYTFTGFRMESGAEFTAYADLEVEKQGRSYQASPALAAGPSGLHPVPAVVPEVGSITLQRMDADHGRIAVSLPAASVGAGVAVVDLSTKPFINLVWIGVLLAFLGTALAGIRRAAETQPAHRERSIATRGREPRPRTETPRGRGAVHAQHLTESEGARS
jgi:cytochrome c biogenesis factor